MADVSVKLDQALAPQVQMQEFSIGEDAKMTNARAFVVMWWGAKPEIVTTAVEAGQRVYIRAHAKRGAAGGAFVCFNIVSFTPRAGAEYDMRQSVGTRGGCTLEVRDRTTGRPAPDFQVHDANAGMPFFLT